MKKLPKAQNPTQAEVAGRRQLPPKPDAKQPRDLTPRGGRWLWFKSLLERPVSCASLAAFRFSVGLVMTLEAYSLCRPNPDAISSGTSTLGTYYTGPGTQIHFPYAAFDWLPLLPAQWIYVIVGALDVAGVTMALGLFYRVSAAIVFLSWGYLFAVESTRTYWQSHYYLELLLIFVLNCMPAAQGYSLDAWFAKRPSRLQTVPFWTIFLLRAQLVIAYFYAGVAKLNADWLLDAVPLRWFLTRSGIIAHYQPYLSPAHLASFQNLLHSPAFAYFLSYTGALFDLAIGFLFLVRRARLFALLLMVIFHATNHFLIFDDIGWFPLVGAATALIFLEPDWPARVWNWLRKPRLAKPDWGWFTAGAILFPVVGATLGWKSKPSAALVEEARPHSGSLPQERGSWGQSVGWAPTEGKSRFSLAPYALALIGVWIAFQVFLPIRHWFIAGDSRFTYEGLSFSWRLKADVHSALPVQIIIEDPAIISDQSGHAEVHWEAWHGDKVIYRRLTPAEIHWATLPEVLIVLEPLSGERIIYNPFAVAGTIHSKQEAQARIAAIWRQLYGHEPAGIEPTLSPSQVLTAIADGLRAGGNATEADQIGSLASLAQELEEKRLSNPAASDARDRILRTLTELRSRDKEGGMLALLRRLNPFGLDGARSTTFLAVQDPLLFDSQSAPVPKLNAGMWKSGPWSGTTQVAKGQGEPLVVYMTEVGPDAKWSLPQSFIIDSHEHSQQLPSIYWNSLKELPISKFNHISNQAFYLRRYARHVARLWQREYGRTPKITAQSMVSFNGRPYQFLVDTNADLASVGVAYLSHNWWVKDLGTSRIPPEALTNAPTW
jgi:hypothetical protein